VPIPGEWPSTALPKTWPVLYERKGPSQKTKKREEPAEGIRGNLQAGNVIGTAAGLMPPGKRGEIVRKSEKCGNET